jgi:hypothetical protein
LKAQLQRVDVLKALEGTLQGVGEEATELRSEDVRELAAITFDGAGLAGEIDSLRRSILNSYWNLAFSEDSALTDPDSPERALRLRIADRLEKDNWCASLVTAIVKGPMALGNLKMILRKRFQLLYTEPSLMSFLDEQLELVTKARDILLSDLLAELGLIPETLKLCEKRPESAEVYIGAQRGTSTYLTTLIKKLGFGPVRRAFYARGLRDDDLDKVVDVEQWGIRSTITDSLVRPSQVYIYRHNLFLRAESDEESERRRRAGESAKKALGGTSASTSGLQGRVGGDHKQSETKGDREDI